MDRDLADTDDATLRAASRVVGVALDTGTGRVPRNLLRDEVFWRLLTSILRGEYRRGQRLPLDVIATDLRVSRTPVREALVPLENLRLVVVQRYVGVVIAHWSVEHMTERIRLVRALLTDPPAGSTPTSEPTGPVSLHEVRSDCGVFVALGVWALRRRSCPVSADWLETQRPVLDLFFTDDIAELHGIHVAAGRRERVADLDQARARAEAGDVDGCVDALVAAADRYVALHDRVQPRAML